MARCRQNHAYYRRRNGRQGSTRISIHPDTFILPDYLVELALLPLPDSRLFREALQSADYLDETELPQWDQEPPYPPSPYTADYANFTKNLVDVMNGRRLRMERLRNAERAARCKTLKEWRGEIEGDLRTAFGDWERMVKLMEAYGEEGDSRASTMAQNLLQWRARYVYTLYTMLEDLL